MNWWLKILNIIVLRNLDMYYHLDKNIIAKNCC